jgi:von Willebrand factor A domain-containing protein 7
VDRAAIIIVICALSSPAQTIDYACIPPFRADPSAIWTSEATGGQVLLLSPREIANPVIAQAQAGSNNQTILRASGALTGRVHEFTAPVEPGVRSLQFSVFAECVKIITITAPSGAQAEGARLSSGRIVMLDTPEPGIWKIKLSGTGYYSAIAQVKANVALALQQSEAAAGRIEAHVAGAFESAHFLLLARDGSELTELALEQTGSEFRGPFTIPVVPFRIAVDGIAASGAAFRRVHPILFGIK